MWDPKIFQTPDGLTVPSAAVVDPSTSLPLGARQALAASIPNGGSVTPTVDLVNACMVGFITPPGWTAAALNIEVSVDSAAWVTAGVFDASGVATGKYGSIATTAGYAVDTKAMLPYRFIRLRSGTLASPIAQADQRDFTIITRLLS